MTGASHFHQDRHNVITAETNDPVNFPPDDPFIVDLHSEVRVDEGYSADFAILNGKAIFDGSNASGQRGLWVTDGTAACTHELAGVNGANSGGLLPKPPNLTAFNGEVPGPILVVGHDHGRRVGWVG